MTTDQQQQEHEHPAIPELGPVQMSESIYRLSTALAKAQGEILPAPKDSENPHFKQRYADLASIREACRAPLAKHGLSVIQVPTCTGQDVSLCTLLMHESGEWIAGTLTMRALQAGPQAIGSCITYARRYALAAMVGVAPDDDDANSASKGDAKGDAQQQPRQQRGQQQQQQQQGQQRPQNPPQQQRPPQQQQQQQPPQAQAPVQPPAAPQQQPAPQQPPVSAPAPQPQPAPTTGVAFPGSGPAGPVAAAAELPGLRGKRLYDTSLGEGLFTQQDIEQFLQGRGLKIGGNIDPKTLDLWESELNRRRALKQQQTPQQPPEPAPQEEVIF